MAKKKTTKKTAAQTTKKVQKETGLPQNIRPIGEHVEENKNIYISQQVYKDIHKFTKNKTVNESGGVLLGTVKEDLGKTNIIISAFIEAKHCESTSTTLTFTHKTWEYIHKEADKKYPDLKILGWIHTHPNFGIFLSEYDKFIHENYFSGPEQIAYVVDPIQKIEGFYFWINDKLERCKGFYIYDKTGVPIVVDDNTMSGQAAPAGEGGSSTMQLLQNIIIGVLAAAVIILSLSHFLLNASYLDYVDKTNQEINTLHGIIAELNDRIEAEHPAEMIEEPEENNGGSD